MELDKSGVEKVTRTQWKVSLVKRILRRMLVESLSSLALIVVFDLVAVLFLHYILAALEHERKIFPLSLFLSLSLMSSLFPRNIPTLFRQRHTITRPGKRGLE